MAASLVLTFLGLTGRLVRYLEEAANGTLAPELVFAIVAGRVPGILQIVLPLSFFLGVLLMVGRLYAEHEADALRAAGFGRRAWLQSLWMPIAGMAVMTLGLSLILAPTTASWVQTKIDQGRQVAGIAGLNPQQFQSIGGQAVFYSAQALDDGRMADVFVHQPGQPDTVFKAQFAYQRLDPETGQRFLVLEDGQRWSGEPTALNWEALSFDEYLVRLELPEQARGGLRVEAMDSRLLMQGDRQAQAQLQWRIALGLMVPVGALLALALGPTAPRGGRWTRFLPGVVLFIVYFGLVNYLHSQMIDGRLPILHAMWPAHLLMLLVAQGIGWRNRQQGLA